MKDIKVGLIGFGTIGTGVIRLIQDNANLIHSRLGANIRLKKIADIDIVRSRGVLIEKGVLTTDAYTILSDPEIDIVVELMGGFEPAKSYILEAVKQKKHVVTANKALLATQGDDIFKEVFNQGVDIGFEASVGGTIPIIKTLRESLVANEILSMSAILNGTSNFILSKMTDENMAFEETLREAQALGYAEANPIYDIEGIDAAHKLTLLLTLAYGKKVSMEKIYREGISKVDLQDVQFARELGYRIKLLAIAINRNGIIEARLHPTMIPFDHLLANVNSNYNAFHIIGDASDTVFLYGQGAGMMPTASAVLSDIIDIARNKIQGIWGRVPPRVRDENTILEINMIPFEDILTNYYLRFSVLDKPGVLSEISGILGRNNISISSVIQKGRMKEGPVSIVMTTHKSQEKDIQKALNIINHLSIVMGNTVLFRIEDNKLK